MMRRRLLIALIFSTLVATDLPRAGAKDVARFVLPEIDIVGLRARGDRVMDELAELYTRSTPAERATIATAFYQLGLKSQSAKQALLQDVHTDDAALRLQVQWALGRVSNDPDVVDVLLDNMRHDDNPLFRDKAACALAHDQIHLSPQQKLRLFERLIDALRDPKDQVRSIAIKVLEIHTGQTKGYRAGAPLAMREQSVKGWLEWLDSYRASL